MLHVKDYTSLNDRSGTNKMLIPYTWHEIILTGFISLYPPRIASKMQGCFTLSLYVSQAVNLLRSTWGSYIYVDQRLVIASIYH